MKTLKFYGSSDDCFEIEGSARGEPDEISPGAVKVCNDHGGLLVVAEYAPTATGVGCWMIGVSLIEEDIPVPDWPMRFTTARNDYSPMLSIEVPDDVRVSLVNAEG